MTVKLLKLFTRYCSYQFLLFTCVYIPNLIQVISLAINFIIYKLVLCCILCHYYFCITLNISEHKETSIIARCSKIYICVKLDCDQFLYTHSAVVNYSALAVSIHLLCSKYTCCCGELCSNIAAVSYTMRVKLFLLSIFQ